MADLLVASSQADADAVDAVRAHHAVLADALQVRVDALAAAADRRDALLGGVARLDLVDWCRRELLPHTRAEEETLYPVAHGLEPGKLLVEALVVEHDLLVRLVTEIASAHDVGPAAASATKLRAVFDSHLQKDDDLILPLLASAPGVSLAELLAAADANEDPSPHQTQGGCDGQACACGEQDPVDDPVLDARSIPHAIRQATILGALDSLPTGAGLVLVAPHDPLPLLDQVQQRWPGGFTLDYQHRGPESWRLRLVRATS